MIFLTNNVIKKYSEMIRTDLDQNNLIIFNLNSILSKIVEPYGPSITNSTVIGSRNSKKRKNDDFIYYGGVGTPKSRTKKAVTKKGNYRPQTKANFRLNTPPRETRKRKIEYEKTTNMTYIINALTELTCKGKISPEYGISATRKALLDPSSYDIVVIANKNIETKSTIRGKMDDIYGMMVIQKGECVKYPELYAINLICVNRNNISKYLLGLYLYTIKINPKYFQWGILELASKYINTEGLCSYSKFGFYHDEVLIEDCFPDKAKGNLPMMVDLHMFSSVNDIIDIVTGRVALRKHELCNIKDKKLQQKIARYLNLAYGLKYLDDEIKDYSYIYNLYTEYKNDIKYMYNALKIQPDYIESGKFKPQKVLKHIDGYIEQLYLQN